jgi:transposase
MSRQIEADHSKQFLLPEAIDDYIGSDHPARFINAVVSQLDIRAFGLRESDTDTEGRPRLGTIVPNGARLLLSMWSYAYFFRIESSEDLQMVFAISRWPLITILV